MVHDIVKILGQLWIDNVGYRAYIFTMRDDIHKKVPRPPKVQTWVKRCLNNSDRLSGRSAAALHDAIADTCTREISETFRKKLVEKISEPSGLFSPLEGVNSPHDLGSRGSYVEAEVLNHAKRLISIGVEAGEAVWKAYECALKNRVDADIRAAAPVFSVERLPDATRVLAHMRSDAISVDYSVYANHLCAAQKPAKLARIRPSISPEENLAVGIGGGGR